MKLISNESKNNVYLSLPENSPQETRFEQLQEGRRAVRRRDRRKGKCQVLDVDRGHIAKWAGAAAAMCDPVRVDMFL